MLGSKRFAFNVLMNWSATAVGMVVPFFLTPFVVRSLGPTAYGIWILAVSTVSYLSLFDLGMRSAVIRFVSKAQAQGEVQELKSAVGAALWFRLLIAGVVALISVLLAVAFPHLFKVPQDLRSAGQITVLLCALGMAITLVSGVFGGILAAIHRFDLLSTITMVQTLARAGGVLILLHSGRGLVSLAWWELTVVTLAGVLTIGIALKIFPHCRVRIARPELQSLKSLWSYSLITFVWMIAVQIVISTDNLVVGAFLSVGLVAYYSIGGSLITYSGQVVSSLCTTFTPLASGLEASGKFDELRALLLRGTQATLAVAMPIALTLFFRGRTFIGLWMVPRYIEISGTVLQILMISQILSTGVLTAGYIMMAIGKHKAAAKWSLAEALINLGLSLILVKRMGLYGVAWGTVVAVSIVTVSFWPRYVRQILDIPIRTYVWQGWGKVLLSSIPFAATCFIADRFWHPHSLVIYFAQVVLTLPVYGLSLLLAFRGDATEIFSSLRRPRAREAELAS